MLYILGLDFLTEFKEGVEEGTHAAVIRISLGELLVDVLQVVKRTNTPLIPQQIQAFRGRILTLRRRGSKVFAAFWSKKNPKK